MILAFLLATATQALLVTKPALLLCYPLAPTIGLVWGAVDDRSGAVDQQHAEVWIAAFRDPGQSLLLSAGVLSGYQSDPGGELLSVVERSAIGDGCDDGSRNNRTNTFNCCKPAACVVLLKDDPLEMFLHRCDPLFQSTEFLV